MGNEKMTILQPENKLPWKSNEELLSVECIVSGSWKFYC